MPGCSRNWLYYLEFRGVINPAKNTRSRYYRRRAYSTEEVETVRELWRLYQQGFRLSAAVDIVGGQAQKPHVDDLVPCEPGQSW